MTAVASELPSSVSSRARREPQPFSRRCGSMPGLWVVLSMLLLLLLLPSARGQGSTTGLYRQEFYVPADPTDPTAPILYNSTQQITLATIFEGYTESLGVNQTATPVDTVCIIESQAGFLDADTGNTINSVDYSCTWSSDVIAVDALPLAFLSFVTDNLIVLMDDMSLQGLPVFEAFAPTVRTAAATDSPTSSPAPMLSPSATPIPTTGLQWHKRPVFTDKNFMSRQTPRIQPHPYYTILPSKLHLPQSLKATRRV